MYFELEEMDLDDSQNCERAGRALADGNWKQMRSSSLGASELKRPNTPPRRPASTSELRRLATPAACSARASLCSLMLAG